MTPRELLLRARAWLRRDRLDQPALGGTPGPRRPARARLRARTAWIPTEARAAARRQLGNTTLVRESSRDAWGFPALDHFLQDLRYAVRGLVHAPGFTLTVIITLGLGIGANAAMFAVIDRLMFRPFPYMRDPGSVHRVYVETNVTRRNTYSTIPYTRYVDLVGTVPVVLATRRRVGMAIRRRTRAGDSRHEGRRRQRVVLQLLRHAAGAGSLLRASGRPGADGIARGGPQLRLLAREVRRA